MRGIVLAGGTGSRLGALTKAINKHLLPVGQYPMLHWPLHVLEYNNIRDITIVSTPRGVGQIAEQFANRRYIYRVQDGPSGIAGAIACAESYSQEHVAVILGDNVFLPPPRISPLFIADERAYCYLKEMPAARTGEFGSPIFDAGGADGSIVTLHEKPSLPTNSYAVTGLYIFSPDVFEKIGRIHPSDRGELEVTDLLNLYAEQGTLQHHIVAGFWGDAGTFNGMAECTAATLKYTS